MTNVMINKKNRTQKGHILEKKPLPNSPPYGGRRKDRLRFGSENK